MRAVNLQRAPTSEIPNLSDHTRLTEEERGRRQGERGGVVATRVGLGTIAIAAPTRGLGDARASRG
jgi:hypothetical protein